MLILQSPLGKENEVEITPPLYHVLNRLSSCVVCACACDVCVCVCVHTMQDTIRNLADKDQLYYMHTVYFTQCNWCKDVIKICRTLKFMLSNILASQSASCYAHNSSFYSTALTNKSGCSRPQG